MLDGVGPGAYALRADVPDVMHSGAVKIRPMRTLDHFAIASGDPSPIGGEVIGVDKQVGGTIVDAWVDQAESVIRYYEIKVSDEDGARTVLLPTNFAVVRTQERRGLPSKVSLYVHAITSTQFADVPLTASADQITMLEEEKIMGYYGAGYFYATPGRADPLL